MSAERVLNFYEENELLNRWDPEPNVITLPARPEVPVDAVERMTQAIENGRQFIRNIDAAREQARAQDEARVAVEQAYELEPANPELILIAS